MTKPLLTALLLLLTLTGMAQKKVTLSGTIKDATTGETLIGATVRIAGQNTTGTATNNYGFYSLTVPEGDYSIVYSYIGYQPLTQQTALHQAKTQNISLQPGNSLQEVVISAGKRNNDNVAAPQMGLEKLNMTQINQVPVVLGEKDILKTITLMPGIKSAGEGNTGFYVRGGASDQNLILLDEATVYNASHLLGFFSTFNSDAIKDVSIYKGGMPAEYGGRLSSVLDVKMNDGNAKNFSLQGGIGLIASRLKAEGPIGDKGSFMISARRTYIDVFTHAARDTDLKNSTLYFYDLNAKANYHLDDKNTVYLSGYFGKDVLGLKNTFGTNWGNSTGTVRWNHLFNNKLFSNTSLIYSNYNYVVEDFQEGNNFKATSKITDLNFKEDLQYSLSSSHYLKFGFYVNHHDIAPGDISTDGASSFNQTNVEHRYGFENAAYISDEWHLNSKLTVLYGLRLSDMLLMGPGSFKTYNTAGTVTNTQSYSSGSVVKSYLNLEPRLSASYMLGDENSLKFSYNRNTQNIHLLSNSTSSNPTDVYVMSSNNIKPEIADQVSAGWFRNFSDNAFEFSAEVYYKWMQNQIDYKDGAQLIANADVESLLTYGSGRAYGLELFLKKKYGRFNGWVGYTLSKAQNKFAAINGGAYYNSSQDRPQDVSVVGIYQLSKRWSLSSSFVYSSGRAITYPTGKYNVNGITVFSYSQRNGYREPATNRLDIGATLEGKEHKRYHSSWTFSIYNLYGYRNPYTITFRDSKTVPNTTEAVQTSIFATAIPSVTWNFNFK
ncbi:outer membrane receptor protein involved in Fe transport [Mucilaginibacter yixingensis]|uniref:Outer membrane receptor protein involved in Fe transport n=1 Tax=Mucilaginibacter yixingensis TaxID=1295612 RepID=A0A2T5J965_9SPHI|nr:TonB-dependent receptor [Mucilaginibacter yixingensis]PTQ96610.1 outer membrane receptor protein involved in Fe transport [Mucilaginibacter yixingensis]